MRYRNMKTGEERDFIQGMKINSLWKPVQRIHSGGRSTVEITEIHPDDMQEDMKKTVTGLDKVPEVPSKKKSSLAKAVAKRNKELAAERKAEAAQEAETVEESI